MARAIREVRVYTRDETETFTNVTSSGWNVTGTVFTILWKNGPLRVQTQFPADAIRRIDKPL